MNSDAESVTRSFSHMGVRRGELVLFTPDRACLVINALEAGKIRVWELESFQLADDNQIHWIFDCIMQIPFDAPNSWQQARDYLDTKRDSELMFAVWAGD